MRGIKCCSKTLYAREGEGPYIGAWRCRYMLNGVERSKKRRKVQRYVEMCRYMGESDIERGMT